MTFITLYLLQSMVTKFHSTWETSLIDSPEICISYNNYIKDNFTPKQDFDHITLKLRLIVNFKIIERKFSRMEQ